mgnify:CR=1 FL=1
MIEEKRVEDSRVETVHIIRPNHLNAAGRLFGGMLMQWLDEVAGMVAKRHTRANVITASVDNLRFIHGAYKGEMVVIVGKVTYVGTTSMEVRVDTYVEHMEDGTFVLFDYKKRDPLSGNAGAVRFVYKDGEETWQMK